MWTPKRILILIAGLALFMTGYGIYAFFLGGIDGLPELPISYAWGDSPPHIGPVENKIEKKLKQAFGDPCPELKRSIQLDLPPKGWGLAANTFEPEPDGRIKLSPFSAFMIPKNQDKKGEKLEINTIRCDVAYLTLDRKISNMAELGNRKVIAVELCRDPAKPPRKPPDKEQPPEPPDITIRNNRGTPFEDGDDLELTINDGHLFFEEAKNLIWTNGNVKLVDFQGKNPTKINAKGMELHLTKENNAAQGKAGGRPKGKKGDTLAGVEKLILLSQVDMQLFVDSRSGFLGGAEAPKQPAAGVAAQETQEPELVIIKTQGRFTYDLPKDLAWFDSPKTGGKGSFRDQVVVRRKHKSPDGDGKQPTQQFPLFDLDEVKCDHLVLQFRRKVEGAASANSDGRSINKEIESARATAWNGEMVDLDMPSEKIHATSLELEFFCATAKRGPKIILRGQPLMAAKEGHVLHAQELVLVGADKNGNGQEASAKGPGQFDMFDKSAPNDAPESRKFPWKAVFKDSLTSTKDRVGNKVFDLLTLKGDAALIDEEHKQALQAQRLLIWLEPDDPDRKANNPTPPTENPSGTPRQKPSKLEAFDQVMLISPDMNVRKADHL